MYEFIDKLEKILEKRKKELPEGSYSTQLFKGGIDRILKKIGEEAGEVIIASKNDDKQEIKNEVADLLFHILIVLQQHGLEFKDVVEILEQRHQIK